jgi:phosphate transport system substrate-binding protein
MVGGEPWLRHTSRVVGCLFLLLGCVTTGCVATVEPHPPVHLEIAGSTSAQPLLEELANAYTNRYTYATIDIKARGTGLGLEALRDGSADIALASRDLNPEEKEGLEGTVIAYDAIAVLVNDRNPVDSLTSAQIRDIFSGKIVSWSEVAGEEADIQVLSREDGSGTREAFEGLVMQGQRVTLTAIVVPGGSAVGQFVADNPATIGYASAVGIPLGARALRIDGFDPDLQALTQGDYPLTRAFILAMKENPGEDVQSFLDFVLSPAGQVIVSRKYGRTR